MQRTKIEYLDYCWNFYPGCNHWKTGVCPLKCCWAHNRAVRFNKGDFEPRLIPDKLLEPMSIKKPSRIGVCFTGDLFGDWVDPETWIVLRDIGLFSTTNVKTGETESISLRHAVLDIIKACPQHTFLMLTKKPENLKKYSPYPDNCWVGVSVCSDKMLDVAVDKLEDISSEHKFISFEPLLERLTLSLDYAFYYSGIKWAIIGRQTPVSKKTAPKIEWIKEIVRAADKAGVPVFLKNKLTNITSGQTWAGKWVEHGNQPKGEELWWHPRQEFPKEG